ncbi:MAG: tetratricopeptide repeat protein [Xanthomonadales bacterium]|nr:tetratricopeptide repeat protein [Xanthomonadales bacterium]
MDFWRRKPAPTPAATIAPAANDDAAVREIAAGNTAEDRGELALARAHYARALELAPALPRVHLNLGNLCLLEGDAGAAIAAYRRALDLDPAHAGAWFNLGNVHFRRREHEAAIAAFERCLALTPAHDDAELALALALTDAGHPEQADGVYRRLLERRPDFVGARANHAQLLARQRDYLAAAAQWSRVLAQQPDYPCAPGHACAARAYACDWEGLAPAVAALERSAIAGQPVALPFHLAILGSSRTAQLAAARRYTADRFPPGAPPSARARTPGRLRLAYVSADFHQHATAALTARLFELHDRARFEVHAWSFGRDDGSPMRRRLEAAFEHFHEVRGWSDEAIARAIHASGCDIAIDLKGYTADARPAIFSAHPAPLQVAWLGFPGTSGNPAFDYLIADRQLIAAEETDDYSERIVWLPDSYQANDDRRAIAATAPGRAALGLPERCFVWCCFNNNFKIVPAVFDVWMRLLLAVPDSVLWLLADNPQAQAALEKEARARGVDPARLVFAPRADLPEHLARQACADLFLDTLPCNAHTTASDALWAGLPVLTCRGESFAGRVGASLLHAAGLPELVTHSLAEYEALALALARDPQRLQALRARLGRGNAGLPLFDSARFCRHLETGFAQMVERHRSGLAPASFDVVADGACRFPRSVE